MEAFMAIPFKAPRPPHRFTVAAEKRRITRHFQLRGVPKSTKGRLLLASWNVANLGAQGRSEAALRLVSHIMKRFDLIAVQEVNEEYRTFEKVVRWMGRDFEYIMTDTAGNNERLAFVYRTSTVVPTELFGELALRPREYPKRTVAVRYTVNGQKRVEKFKNLRFTPFDRNPFIGSFEAGAIDFTLANVHLYFGKFQDSRTKKERSRYARRVLEIYALARWANRRLNRKATYDRDIVLLGDMNVPAMDPKESTYKALTKFGWKPLKYVSKTAGSNLGNDKTYDQMAFAPGSIKRRVKAFGVFDFDNAIFRPLWQKLRAKHSKARATQKFNSHVKFHISDHRPLWVQLDITP
jgi:endonuclease/exonuclease/phosphatase family metal-dependent hydrolase